MRTFMATWFIITTANSPSRSWRETSPDPCYFLLFRDRFLVLSLSYLIAGTSHPCLLIDTSCCAITPILLPLSFSTVIMFGRGVHEHDKLIDEYEHLRNEPRADEALHTLRKIASLVKPIMRKHGWKVRTLQEFYPRENNLLGLNVNSGQRICLRLRQAFDRTQFLALESVVDTMLHE